MGIGHDPTRLLAFRRPVGPLEAAEDGFEYPVLAQKLEAWLLKTVPSENAHPAPLTLQTASGAAFLEKSGSSWPASSCGCLRFLMPGFRFVNSALQPLLRCCCAAVL